LDSFYKEKNKLENKQLDALFPGFSKLFYDLNDTKISIPTMSWLKSPNPWIKETSIPVFQEKIDFRLLEGDLEDQKRRSKPVQTILDDVRKGKRSSRQNVYFLLGISGCGKTKAIFDVSKEEYVILLDFGEKTRAEDVSNLMKGITSLANANDTNIHDSSGDLVFRTFLSRYYLLNFLIGTKQIQNPRDWLLLQLNKEIQPILKTINQFLRQFEWEAMTEIFGRFQEWFRINKLSMIIAIDEANILLETLPNRFVDSRGNQNTRPLSSLVISTVSKLIVNAAPLIISGTHLRIADRDTMESCTHQNRRIPIPSSE
jgi:hypothetical protein